jgi:hypothetical protein
VPIQQVEKKREVYFDKDGITIKSKLVLPADTTIFSYAPYVNLEADEATLETTATFSGYMRYNVLTATLEELYFDVDNKIDLALGLTLDVTAPYTQTFKYSPGDLTYSFVNVPGIINIGPALGFAIGVELAASAAVTLTTGITVGVEKGNIHLDLVNAAKTSASGWDNPSFTASANISEKAAIGVNPFIDVSVELSFDLLGGLLDLSSGIKAQPKFNNNFILTAQQDVDPSGGVSQPIGDGTCLQGLEIKSDFVFSVIAFVTQFWSETLYSVTVPIADQCYTWL